MDNSSRSREVKDHCPRSQFFSPTKYRRSSAGTPQPSCWATGEEDSEDEACGTPLNVSSGSALLESMHTICLETPKCETAVSSIHNQQNAQGGEDSRSSLKSCSGLRKTSFPPQTPTKVLVNSLSCVNAASATVSTSGSTASSQSPAAPPQSTVQPVIVSPHPVTRPVVLPPLSAWYPPGAPLFVNELGEPVIARPPLPPYSSDPTGNDLPRDYKVVQYYFNIGVQWYQQIYWNPMVQMQQMYQQSPTEQYQGFSTAQPMTEQSLQQQYTDAWRFNDNWGRPEFPPNGFAPNVKAAPVSRGSLLPSHD